MLRKSLVLVLLLSTLFIATGCSVINSTTAPAPVATESVKQESEVETVLLKKGSLIVKEFIDCCEFETDKYFSYSHNDEFFGLINTLGFQTASILDVETATKVYALRITTGYYNSKYAYGEAIGVMDADEIDGAIKTLNYIKQNLSSLKDYSEVVYKASSGMEVGAYHSSTGEKLYVKVNSDATKFYSIDKIDSLIKAFEKVASTLNQNSSSSAVQ